VAVVDPWARHATTVAMPGEMSPCDLSPIIQCLNETVFSSLSEARAVLASWQGDYNGVRPHSGLANKTPWQFRSDHLAVAADCTNGQNLNPGLGDLAVRWRPRSNARWPR